MGANPNSSDDLVAMAAGTKAYASIDAAAAELKAVACGAATGATSRRIYEFKLL